MKATLKVLILLIAASQISLSVKPEMFSQVNPERSSSLEELNDIKQNIKNELKALKESLKHQGGKASTQLKGDLQELREAKRTVENQIDDSIKSSNQFPSHEEVLKEVEPVAIKTAQEDPAPEDDLPEKDPEIEEKNLEEDFEEDLEEDLDEDLEEDVEEKKFAVKKVPQKKAWSKFANGIRISPGKIKKFFTKIFSTVKATNTHYEINEYQSKDKKKYYIIITMPNIAEEQVRIAIHETSKEHYSLNVIAQTHTKKRATHKKTENSVAQQILQPTFVNRECRDFHYYNGALEVVVDLPDNVKHDTYSVEFLDHALKIEFEQE